MTRPRFSRVGRATLILLVFFAVDKVLAFVRQVLIARTFGLSPELDAFNAANNLPDLLYAFISGGALAMAFIPVLSEVLTQEGRSAMWRLFSQVANLAFAVTAGLALVIALFAEEVVRWRFGIAPGFAPEWQDLTVRLLRLDLLGTLIFSLSGMVSAGLYAQQHFWLPALAPVMYNLGQIFGIAVLAPENGLRLGPLTLPGLGLGIYGLVYGVLMGALLHLGVQIPGLWRFGFRWWPELTLRAPRVIQVLRLMGPRILTIFFVHLIFLARDNLASHLGVGAVTALAYGWFIMQVPETLLGTTLGLALLPTLSEYSARADWAGYTRTLNQGVRAIIALTVPVAGVLAVALPALLGVLGLQFQDTQLVVATTRAYLLGMTGHALLELAARGFYARQKALPPLAASLLNTTVYVLLALLFGSRLGAVGIALSNALAFTGEALLLLGLTARSHPRVLRLNGTWWRTLAALALGAGGAAVLLRVLGNGLLAGLVATLVGGGLALPWMLYEIYPLFAPRLGLRKARA